jgi:hypothetical protein
MPALFAVVSGKTNYNIFTRKHAQINLLGLPWEKLKWSAARAARGLISVHKQCGIGGKTVLLIKQARACCSVKYFKNNIRVIIGRISLRGMIAAYDRGYIHL